MTRQSIQVHRFRDSAAICLPTGDTCYVSAREAELMAESILRIADSIRSVPFPESASLTRTFRPQDQSAGLPFAARNRYGRALPRSAQWRVTYDIVTPESAEHGDYADSGFVNADGLPVAALIGRETEGVAMTLREALELCQPSEDSGTWLTETEGRVDPATGESESRSLHPPRNITPASYARLKRLLGVDQCGG